MASSTIRRTAHATISSLSSASSSLSTHLLNLPTTYSTLVASNAQSITSIESSLRSLSYLLPGARLADSELASESLHSFIQLLSIYHDNLLKKRASFINSSHALSKPQAYTHTHTTTTTLPKPPTKPSLHYKYTSHLSSSLPLYTRLATLLKIAEYTQLLWEMLARRSRGGEKSRWRIVVLLETFKAVCRLVLMRITGSRPLVSPPLPQREDFAPVEPEGSSEEDITEDELLMADNEDFPSMEANSTFHAGVPTPPLSDSGKPSTSPIPATVPSSRDTFLLPRTGLTLPSLPSPDAIARYLQEHVLTSDDVKPAKNLLHRLTSLQSQAAEVLYILRPLVYALLMQRLASRYGYVGSGYRKIWTPWIVGFLVEYASLTLSRHDLRTRIPSGERAGLSALEKEEFSKRHWNMAWWGMRGAFYENVTRTYVRGLAGVVRGRVPVVGELVAGVVEDYEHLWGEWVFSTSTL